MNIPGASSSFAQNPIASSAGRRVDILGVGHASFTAINRRFYRALAASGVTVELVIPRVLVGLTRTIADPKEDCDPAIHWTEVKGRNNRFWRFTRLAEILQARRPKIIYLENDPASYMAVQVARWAAKNDASVICYININDIPFIRTSLRHLQFKRAARTLLYRALTCCSRRGIDAVFAISNDGVEAMRTLGVEQKTHIMPLGYDAGMFFPNVYARERVRRELKLEKVTIAYFGRVVAIKGVHVLLDALELLCEFDWQFLIDEFSENTADDYARGIRRRLSDNLWLAARTATFNSSHEMMPDYMNACDIAVLPSIWKEQYGRVIPEAMGCGCAVIVSNAGALPEIVGDAGLVTPKNDPRELAAGLRLLLKNPEIRADYAKRGLKRAINKLSITAQVASVRPTIDSILASREK